MFGIGFPELLLILAIALMVIGPRRLPDIAKALGRALGEFKRATDEFKQSINEETRAAEIREQILKGGKIYPPEANRASRTPQATEEQNQSAADSGVNPQPPPLGPLASAAKTAPQPEPSVDKTPQPGRDDEHDG